LATSCSGAPPNRCVACCGFCWNVNALAASKKTASRLEKRFFIARSVTA
jgi:hypothetical protein